MSDEMLSRLEKLETDVENVKKQMRKKAEKQKLTLQEKFDIHDRSQRLLSEFEVMRIEDAPLNAAQISELKTIVKCLAELIDHALGVEFP